MLNISLRVSLSTPLAPVNLFRLKHDYERTNPPPRTFGSTDVIPEPFPVNPEHQIAIKGDPRLLNLLCELNPEYTRERVMDLLDVGLCWCNQQWGVFHRPIVTGGAVLEADRVEGGRVYIKYIPWGECPPADYVLAHHLSYLATSVHRDGRVQFMMRPNGHGDYTVRSKVRMFVVSEQPLWLPTGDLQQLPAGFVPDEVWRS